MPSKKIKDSEGFIVGWNKKVKNARDITFFVRYKDFIGPMPIKPIDLARFLVNKIKEIKKKK